MILTFALLLSVIRDESVTYVRQEFKSERQCEVAAASFYKALNWRENEIVYSCKEKKLKPRKKRNKKP